MERESSIACYRLVSPSVCRSVRLSHSILSHTRCLQSASAHAHASPPNPLPADRSRDHIEQLLAAAVPIPGQDGVIRERVGRRDERERPANRASHAFCLSGI